MRLTTLFAAAAMLTLAACSGQGAKTVAKAPDSVPMMAKEDVKKIVHEYLLENPEVLVEAFTELDKKRAAENFANLTAHDNDPSLGPKNAPITMVEFFDYNCGFCKAANPWVFQQLDDKRGQVRIVFKEFPILHEDSILASKAALAAERQGKYREMHLALMKTKDFNQDHLDAIAKSIGLNLDKFRKDIADPEFQAHIERVHREAAEASVDATPGFFINGVALQGYSEERLEAMMKEARDKLKS